MTSFEPSPARSRDSYLERLCLPAGLAYLFLLVTLFAPLAIWASKRGELVSSPTELAPHLLGWVPGLLLLAAGVAAFLLPVRLTRFPGVLVFVAALYAVVELHLLGGTGWLIRVLVVAAILGGVFLLRKGIHRIAVWILAGLILAGFAQIALSMRGTVEPSAEGEGEGAASSYTDFFTFSKDDNIIHIVMDELQYSFFERVVRAEFPDYESRLEGFVFYQNHLGLYPDTQLSMSSMFRSSLFRNQSPTAEWMATQGDPTLFEELVSQGVEVDMMSAFSLSELAGLRGIDRNTIPVPYVDFSTLAGGGWPLGSVALEAERLRDLMIQRLMPDRSQPQAEAPEPVTRADAGDSPVERTPAPKPGTVAFAQEKQLSQAEILRDWGTYSRVGTRGTLYRYLHTLATSPPALLDADCNLREGARTPNWDNLYPQTTCAVRRLFGFFERLERIGAYDNSTIIVHADRGKRHAWQADSHLETFVFGEVQNPPVFDFAFSRVVSSAMPVLLVKQKGARHPLKVSSAPTSFADIAPTIRHLAGIPLAPEERTIFDIGEKEERVRSFFYYDYPQRNDPYLDRLVEYRVDGPVWAPASWSQVAVHLGPHSDFNNDRIDMGAPAYRHHEREGWLQGTDNKDKRRTVAYTLGPVAEIEVAFPDRSDRTMTVTMKSMVHDQVLDVAVNGRSLGAIDMGREIGRFKAYSVRLPGKSLRGTPSRLNVISFRPRKLKARWQRDQQRIPYGVGIDRIEFERR